MAHSSRLGVFVIDCQTDDLTEAVAFWEGALGRKATLDAEGRYAAFEGGYPRILLQAVDHAPRIHADIEADDKDAECERLKALGAKEIARVKRWIVMEAPTGHRFCVINPQGDDFPGDAARWED